MTRPPTLRRADGPDFSSRTNTISKVSILGSVFILAAVSWLLTVIFRSDYLTGRVWVVNCRFPLVTSIMPVWTRSRKKERVRGDLN